MITTNVLQRTFHIQYGNATGTAFAIDRDGKQYLVTARHVVEGIRCGDNLKIYHDQQWKELSIAIVGMGNDQIDVTVLGCPVRLAPSHPLEASSAGLYIGQQVYFVGFPFGWDGGHGEMNNDFPFPFTKSGIVSAIMFEASRFIIDAHVNSGFSGGPVVFVSPSQPQNQFRVAGIVSADSRPIVRPVVSKSGNPLAGSDGKPVAYFQENQGFVIVYSIRHATELIDANPIGFQLPIENDL